PVEKQIALAFAGTRGLLRDVSLENVKKWQEKYLSLLETNGKETLVRLQKGELIAEDEEALKAFAVEASKKLV
ncbi:MAG TPA: F0F1 ATP synthase subunit alpha, partial [Salinivirgaceae bacterium]|nr:F0F1 ATP synthase subunit alpha [Salinivirgaceae bacterium]